MNLNSYTYTYGICPIDMRPKGYNIYNNSSHLI